MFTVFLSSNSTGYLSALRTGTIPVVPAEYRNITNTIASHWIREGIWVEGSLGQLNQLIERLSTLVTSPELVEELEQKVALADVQRRVLAFSLPEAPSPIQKHLKLFVALLSRRDACGRREVIRNTWLKSFYSNKDVVMNHKFFISSSSGVACDETDVVELDVPDHYLTLTLKVHAMIEYILRTSSIEFDILLKLDDDVFIRPAGIIEHLIRNTRDMYIWGSICPFSMPVRDSEDVAHYVSFEDYPSNYTYYPLYPRGFAYALSRPLLEEILRSREHDPTDLRVPFEDVSIGLTVQRILPRKRSVTLDDRSENRFARLPTCDANEESGITGETWIIHHINSTKIACMYSQDQSARDICDCI
jgi:hypothetical protein